MSGSDSQLADFDTIFFDVYGTLCDWETGIYEGLKPLLSQFPTSSAWSRKEALETFTSIESDLQSEHPTLLYRDLLAKAHQVLEQRLRGQDTSPSNDSDHTLFGNSIKNWPLFPDTTKALRILSKHYKLCVLSNVDRQSFSHTLAKLSDDEAHPELYHPPPGESKNVNWFPQDTPNSKSPFTLILTAQDTGVYKPDLGGFEAALRIVNSEPRFGVSGDGDRGGSAKERVLWVAQSLFHDVEPATKMGLTSVWIDRAGAAMGLNAGHTYKWKFGTLGEMADEVEKEKKRGEGK
ncbi:hypothetical protein V5O48_015065 [Marasmius crinis-equi]|uniref:Haloacid dehalogenase n=1 Tax=Marasmius crinis-equi TaxID=585013 RepID=A0ABR3EVL4_9AGAR